MSSAEIIAAQPILLSLTAELNKRLASHQAAGRIPRLAVIVASSDPAVLSYSRSKVARGKEFGIAVEVIEVHPAAGAHELNHMVERLAIDPTIHGIVLELPVDEAFDGEAAIERIPPSKDVDGLGVTSLGKLMAGNESETLIAATPQSCILLAETRGSLAGKRVALVGRGRTVGRPLAAMLINRHATVQWCHSRTIDLADILGRCDVVFTATGQAGVINAKNVRSGQIVIDAGITYRDGKLCGDVDQAAISPIVAALTPVPGGVGKLTPVLLLSNVVTAMERQHVA